MTTPQVAVTLKPCPFCGCAMRLEKRKQDVPDPIFGRREWYRPVAATRHNGHGGFCHGEDARGSASEEAAIDRWNTRSHTTEADEVARLREALRRIASCQSHHPGDVVAIARTALGDTQ